MSYTAVSATREQLVSEGQCALQQGRFAQSLLAFEQAVPMGPPLENLHTLLALAAAQAGVFHKVLPALQQELAAFPNSQSARALLSDIDADCSRNKLFARPFQAGEKYVLAGLSPDGSGTGRFLEALLPLAEARGYFPLHPTIGSRFGLAERVRLSSIQHSTILLLHPQTIGWPLVSHLLQTKNRIAMYVLDNSFFCLRSYNYRDGQPNECLDCVGNLAACHASCEPFPSGSNKVETLTAMQVLKDTSSQITFFCQSEAQRRLVLRHFGPMTEAHVVGMKTAELAEFIARPRFDVVYHAEELAAKGFWYALELAKCLPELSFLIPSDRNELEKKFGSQDWPQNVTLRALRWDSGLAEEVRRCRMVLCPSLWSAAIEGAVLKSLHENGKVAVVNSEFGFSSEIPSEIALHLDRNVERAALQLREALHALQPSEKARAWGAQYLQSVALEQIFEVLDLKGRTV